MLVRKVRSFISDLATFPTRVLRGIRLRILVLRAIYSASIVERASGPCSFDCHRRGHLASEMTKLVHDLMQTGF